MLSATYLVLLFMQDLYISVILVLQLASWGCKFLNKVSRWVLSQCDCSKNKHSSKNHTFFDVWHSVIFNSSVQKLKEVLEKL